MGLLYDFSHAVNYYYIMHDFSHALYNNIYCMTLVMQLSKHDVRSALARRYRQG